MFKDTNELVFVYGTLKKDQSNHRLLESSRYVDRAKTLMESYNMYDGGFPYVSYSEYTGRAVWGEIYLVTDPDIMRRLDQLEGVPHHYVRHHTVVITEVVSTIVTPSLKFFNEGKYGDRYFNATMYVASDSVKARLDEREPMMPWGSWPKDEREDEDNDPNVPRPILSPWSTPALYAPWVEKAFKPMYDLNIADDVLLRELEVAPVPPARPWAAHEIAVADARLGLPQNAFWQRWGGRDQPGN